MFKIQSETSTETISLQQIPPGGATISVGGATLDPAPFVSMSLEQYRTNDIVVGGALIISLNGTVYTDGGGFGDVSAQLKNRLDIAKNSGCVPVVINCGGAVLVNGNGMIRGFTIDEGPDPTWTQIAAYSVEIELHINNGQLVVEPNPAVNSYITNNEVIKEFSESITLTVDNDAFAVDNAQGQKIGRAHAKYSFSISATGGSVSCKSVGTKKTGIEAAEEVVKRRIGSIANGTINGSLGNPTAINAALAQYHGGAKYLQVRSMDADAINGTLTVTGDMILRPSGITYPQAFVDVTVDSRGEVGQAGSTVTVSGNIEGLYNTSFTDLITNSSFAGASANKIGNAESAFGGIKGIAQALASTYLEAAIVDPCQSTSGLSAICPTTPTPPTQCSLRLVSRNITRNFGQGTISFTDEYSTAKNCSIPGASSVETEVTHTYPTDVFAEFTIPFRGEPLMQDLGTTTKEMISVNVNVTIQNAGCDVQSTSSVQGCAVGLVDELGSAEGADGWYVTQYSITKTNVGGLRISKEWTKPYNC